MLVCPSQIVPLAQVKLTYEALRKVAPDPQKCVFRPKALTAPRRLVYAA